MVDTAEIMALVVAAAVASTEEEEAIEVGDLEKKEVEETEDMLTLMTQLSMHSRFRIQIGRSCPMMTFSEVR